MRKSKQRYSSTFEFVYASCKCGWSEVRKRRRYYIIRQLFSICGKRHERCPKCGNIVREIKLLSKV